MYTLSRRLRLTLAAALSVPCLSGMENGPEIRSVDPIRVRAEPGHYYRYYHELGDEPGRGVSLPAEGYRIQDIFGRLPGVSLQESFGGIDPPRISARGSGIQSAPVTRGLEWRWNGFSLGLADGTFWLPAIEAGWVRDAVVLTAAEAGVAQMGGGIHLATESLYHNGQGRLRAAIASPAAGRLSAEIRKVSGPAQLNAAVALLRDDGWRRHAEQRRESAQLYGVLPLGEGAQWESQLYFSRPRIMVPGPLSAAMAGADPRQNAPPVIRDQPRRTSEFVLLGNRFVLERDSFGAALGLTVIHARDEFQQLLPNGIQQSRGTDWRLEGRLAQEWAGEQRFETVVEFGLAGGTRQVERYRNIQGERGPQMGDNRYQPWSLRARLEQLWRPQDSHRIGAGFTLFGGRRKIFDQQPQVMPGPGTSLNLESWHAAPHLYWEWSPVAGHRLRLAGSRTVEGPTLDDLLYTAGPMNARHLESRELDWQRAHTVEVRWIGRRGEADWEVAFYTADWSREFLSLADGDGGMRGVVNAGRTRRRGAEILIESGIFHSDVWSLSGWANYQYSDFRFVADPVYGNRRLGGIPAHQGAAGLHLAYGDAWRFTPGLRWQGGATYADHANTLAYGGYGIWTLGARRDFSTGWHMALEISNLLDRVYVASTAGILDRARQAGNDLIFLPGSGRRIEWSAGYAW